MYLVESCCAIHGKFEVNGDILSLYQHLRTIEECCIVTLSIKPAGGLTVNLYLALGGSGFTTHQSYLNLAFGALSTMVSLTLGSSDNKDNDTGTGVS